MRDATARLVDCSLSQQISIHASHAGRDHPSSLHRSTRIISIHASHAGRDDICCRLLQLFKFQSTRPMRDATLTDYKIDKLTEISIHASHAGRDLTNATLPSFIFNFNPRVPCGTRRLRCNTSQSCNKFQSTRPMRDAT